MLSLRALLAAFVLPFALRAHDPGISTAQGELTPGALVLTTGFAPTDIQTLLPASFPRADVWGQIEFEAARPLLLALAPGLWDVAWSGAKVPPREVSVELLPGDNVSFRHILPVPNSKGSSLCGRRGFRIFRRGTDSSWSSPIPPVRPWRTRQQS